MSAWDFLSFGKLEQFLVSKKTSSDEKKIKWYEFGTISYERDQSIRFYTPQTGSTSIPPFELKTQIKKKVKFDKMKLSLLYSDGRPISKLKYNDLQSLLQYMPSHCHAFYETLKFSEENEKDYALDDRRRIRSRLIVFTTARTMFLLDSVRLCSIWHFSLINIHWKNEIPYNTEIWVYQKLTQVKTLFSGQKHISWFLLRKGSDKHRLQCIVHLLFWFILLQQINVVSAMHRCQRAKHMCFERKCAFT